MKLQIKKIFTVKSLFYILCGMLIGLGAVLPGISGGVLCVIFGIYRPVMRLLSHPFRALKEELPVLAPTIVGIGVGFLAVSKLLGFVLERFPNQSVCLFVGLIFGMIPLLFKEAGEQGRKKKDYFFMLLAFAVVLTALIVLQVVSFTVTPNFGWYIFCGFCVALSIIIPGMSFSTLLMPLKLYTPLVTGIGNFDFSVLIPTVIGALATVILLARGASWLMKKHYSAMSHAIIGIVVAATLVIIPFGSFTEGLWSCVANVLCLFIGIAVSLVFAKLDALKKRAEEDIN